MSPERKEPESDRKDRDRVHQHNANAREFSDSKSDYTTLDERRGR